MPDLTTIHKPTPQEYLDSLTPYELYELSCDIHQKEYFCECLIDVETLSDDEIRENLKTLSERLNLVNDKDKKLLTFLFYEYI